MPISAATNAVLKYSGNDTTNLFSVTFDTYQNSDIKVLIENSTSGVLTELTEDVTYTLSDVGVPNQNAEVTLINSGESYFGVGGFLDTGYRVIIEFDDVAYQGTNLANLGRFSSANFGKAVDRATMFIKKVFSKVDRALKVSYKDRDAGFDPLLPLASGNGDKVLKVNPSGTAFEFGTILTGDFVTAQPSVQNLTLDAGDTIAAGGGRYIDYTKVQGNGGAVNLTSVPQIAVGTIDGSLLIVQGAHAVNTLQLDDGDGLNLNGSIVLGLKDSVTLIWDNTNSTWNEVSRNA